MPLLMGFSVSYKNALTCFFHYPLLVGLGPGTLGSRAFALVHVEKAANVDSMSTDTCAILTEIVLLRSTKQRRLCLDQSDRRYDVFRHGEPVSRYE